MSKEISIEVVAAKILLVRGKRVMLDRDLADLYGVPTGVLNQAVKRNKDRFPEDFMFLLTKEEFSSLISQFVISKRGGTRKLPHVFTEQGVAMLSSVLNSERAVQVNIAIMRAFVKLREILLTHKDLADKIEKLEQKYSEHSQQIREIFEIIKQMLNPPPEPPKPKIGFHT
jgi:hypothetical protein